MNAPFLAAQDGVENWNKVRHRLAGAGAAGDDVGLAVPRAGNGFGLVAVEVERRPRRAIVNKDVRTTGMQDTLRHKLADSLRLLISKVEL